MGCNNKDQSQDQGATSPQSSEADASLAEAVFLEHCVSTNSLLLIGFIWKIWP